MGVDGGAGLRERIRGRVRFYDDRSRYLDRFGWLLAITAVTLVLAALVDLNDATTGRVHEAGALVMNYSGAATLMLAMSAAGVSRRWRVVVGVVVGATLVALTLAMGLLLVTGEVVRRQHLSPPVAATAYVLLAFVVVVRRLLVHRQMSGSTLLGAVVGYLLIPLWFYYVFLCVNAIQDVPFFGRTEPTTAFMYASLTNATTLGSALEPRGAFASLLTAIEAIVGQLFLVTFVAMIVGLVATRWSGRSSG